MNTRLSDRGYSLTELLLVVAVIAVVAVVAVPSFTDIQVRRLQIAASEVESALRFARHESIRTGIPHGVRKPGGSNGFSVFRMDIDQDPPVEVHDVPHPLAEKRPYRLNLATWRRTEGTTVSAYFNIYGDDVAHEAISFNARGEPVDGVTGKTLASPQGGFLLSNGDRGTRISLSWLAGRVTSSEVGAVINDPAIAF